MTHVLSAPTPIATMRRAAARMWTDPDSRSVLIGIFAVLFVHLLLFATAPYLLRSDPTRAVSKSAAPRQFSIEISPDAFAKLKPKPTPLPIKYVEANPNAPENVPDKTTNFSSKNSQLAHRFLGEVLSDLHHASDPGAIGFTRANRHTTATRQSL